MTKILRTSRGLVSKSKSFYWPKMVKNRYFVIQNVKDETQIRVYKINNERIIHFSHFISVKVKKNYRKSKAQFREKLKKSRLRKNYGFLTKKPVYLKNPMRYLLLSRR